MLQKSCLPLTATRLIAYLAFTLAIFPALSGCGGSSSSNAPNLPSPSPTPSEEPGRTADLCSHSGPYIAQPGWDAPCQTAIQPTRKWTVLVYMNSANDLEEFGLLNLNQLEQYGSDNNVTFVAQFKRIHAKIGDDKSDGDWVGTRRYVVRRDNDTHHISSPVLSTRADLDMGNPATLQEFVQWGIQTFPAQHYAIILWSHASGWRSRSIKPTARYFSIDDEKGTHIDTIDIDSAIDMGNGRKWDLVSWDACLMQMLEVGYEIKDKTRWMVGSEELSPAEGLPYDILANKLLTHPDADGRFLGETICDAMFDTYENNFPLMTESLLDTSKIAALAGAVNNLGSVLLNAKATYGEAIASARDLSEQYYYPNNKDLLDFTRLIQQSIPDANVQNAALQVENAAHATIVRNVHASSHPNSQGVAIYLPTPNGYRRDDIEQVNGFGPRYTKLLFAQDAPNWQSFLTQGPP